MYVPEPYRPGDLEEIRGFIEEHPFGVLVNQVQNRPWGTHLPFTHESTEDGKDILHSHMAKRNPQWQEMKEEELLVIFQGPDAYISSSWYEAESVPTWNYLAVHAYGRARILEGNELKESMRKQMDRYERDQEDPLSLDEMSEALYQKEIKGVVGFVIEVSEFQAAYKLSQDRSEKDQKNVTAALEQKGNPSSKATAKKMKEKGPKRGR